MEIELTWLDVKETYRFLKENYNNIPIIAPPTGTIRPYTITPELTRMDERKKRIKALSHLFGPEYAQRLMYLHLALDRFIRLAMPINRLSSILNETFLYFERYLYMKLDWQKGEPGFYRDHSIHAASESYLGYFLLKGSPVLEQKFIDYFKMDNKITRYIKDNCPIGNSTPRLLHILYRSWFIASIFHDLGYVISFSRESREKMMGFHRHSDLLLKAQRSSFDDIQLLLGNSLLFNTVEQSKLEYSYNQNNHGTFSAFLLLSTFFSPPAFDGIEPLDRVAIELAAHAIFYHDNLKEKKAHLIEKDFPKGIQFDVYTHYFKKVKRPNLKLKTLLAEKNIEPGQLYKINLPTNEDDKSNRVSFQESPLAFYLRFIDELHVFGRNSLVTDMVDQELSKESPFSYSMPNTRNIVRFPAQIVELTEENVLNVYFAADASLYSRERHGVKNPYRAYGEGKQEHYSKGIEPLLGELYWLQQSNQEAKLFKDISFFFIEIWPGK